LQRFKPGKKPQTKSVTLKPVIQPIFVYLLACIAMQPAVGQRPSDGLSRSIKPTTDFDQRFYYLPAETQNVWGYRVGAFINDKYKIGIGGYYMNKSNTVISAIAFSGTGADEFTINKKLYLGTIYYEPYLLRRGLWEASLVFETGYGRAVNYSMDNTLNKMTAESNTLLIPAGAGLSINFKLPALFHLQEFRWVGINIMGGYRTTLYRQDEEYDYNAVYWSLSGAVFLDRMFEDLRNWKKERQTARNKKAIELHY